MELCGAIKHHWGQLRIVPHGRLHDQYQREEYLCPGTLSFAAGVIDKKGGFCVKVREHLDEFAEDGTRFWIARTRWYDLNSPYLIVRDPVVWEDIPWLFRECEMTILAWLRAQNDPDCWEIVGLKKWLARRNAEHIERLGRDEFGRQYRRFWNRDLD